MIGERILLPLSRPGSEGMTVRGTTPTVLSCRGSRVPAERGSGQRPSPNALGFLPDAPDVRERFPSWPAKRACPRAPAEPRVTPRYQHPEARHHRLAGAGLGPPRRFSLHGFGFRGHSHLPGSPDRTEQICHSEPMSTIARQPPERLRTQERCYGRPCCRPFPDSPPGSSAPAWL